MTERIEAPLKTNLIASFDGRVLEIFSGSKTTCTASVWPVRPVHVSS